MSATSQPEDRRHLSSEDELLHRLDQLDGSLRDRIDQDHRFQSGVPEHQRATDLDFILMSGLTRPAPENLLSPADFSRPISFFEEGVADVDDLMAPSTIDSEPVADEVLGVAPAPPDAFHGDSNIIEMPGISPPEDAPQAEPEPVDDTAMEEPDVEAPSAIAIEEPDELPAPVEDLLEQAEEAPPEVFEVAPAIIEKAEEVTETTPAHESAAQADSSPDPSFADEIASSEDEVSLLIDQYLKSARQEAVESVAPPEPEPAGFYDVEPAPQEAFEEPIPEPELEPAGVSDVEPAPQEAFEEPIPEPEPEPEPEPKPEPELEPLIAAAPTMETETVAAPPQEETPEPPDLAEAELLLRALENQPRDLPPSPATEMPAPVSTEPAAHQAGNVRDLPVREPMTRHSARRSRRSRGHARRHRVRLVLTAAAVAVAAATITGAYLWLLPVFSTPEARMASAERLAAGGWYSQASAAFEAFASAYPQHPSRSSAEFLAAHFGVMAPARDFDEEQAVARRSLALFEKFLRDNPTHAKAPRAWTMVAQLHYKLGQYQEAVNILHDPVLRLRDPESALPGLRTLARAYVRLGEHEAAVSAYQQAAAFAGNYAPDADYDELGDLLKLRADRADDAQEVQKLRQAAIENWNYAIRVPGIDPAYKAKIQDKIKWLESQIGEQQQPPATPETSAVAAGPAEPAPAPVPASQPVTPAPAVDPAAEARFLGGGPGTDSVQ